MKNKATTKRPVRRRLSMLLAALGVLVMSSGAALLVTASPATAANKVGICHATNSDSNPYVFISVDDDSAKLQGHLAHRQTPNKTWKTAGTFNGVPHNAGDPKPDLIGSFTDDQGVFHLYDGNITAASCVNSTPPAKDDATADVDFEDPSCANKNVVSYDTVGDHVSFAVTNGSATPGAHIEVTATADAGFTFSGGGTTEVFKHDYPAAVDLNAPPCVTADATADVVFTDASCGAPNAASYVTSGDHVSFAITSGSATPGSDIQVTATADAGHTFGNLATKKVFTHHFADAVDPNAPPCVVVSPPTPDATATVDFTDPTCANGNDASYTTGGDHVTFAVTSGDAAPGDSIEVTATADAGHTFADLSTTKAFTHQFDDEVDLNGVECIGVTPPSTPPVITPTLVHAGLADTVRDLRGTQGIVLLGLGMVMLLVAGGLSRSKA